MRTGDGRVTGRPIRVALAVTVDSTRDMVGGGGR